MSFLGSIGSFYTHLTAPIIKNVVTPVTTKVAPTTIPILSSAIKLGSLASGQGSFEQLAASVLSQFAFPALASSLSRPPPTFYSYDQLEGAQPMALNIGGILGAVGGILGSTNQTQNPYIQGISGALSLAGQFVPTTTQRPAAAPAAQVLGTARPISMGGVSVSRGLTQEIFNAGQKVLMRLGIRYPASTGGFTSVLKRAISSVASLARRTPAGTIVSILAGLGLTAYEANLLTAWHSQRRRGRRMNPANSKALRRAARRIRSFHKLCTQTDLLRASRRGGSRTQRCGTCKKSPCRC